MQLFAVAYRTSFHRMSLKTDHCLRERPGTTVQKWTVPGAGLRAASGVCVH